MIMPIVAYSKLKPLRQAKGLNQSEIAAELAISRPTYVLMEQGGKEPTITQLFTLARLFGVDVRELCSNVPSLALDTANYPKFKELVTTSIIHGANGGKITKTKLAILTYLADFAWYRLHAAPLTGTTYRCLGRGPVADSYFRVIDELYEAQTVTIEPSGTGMIIRAIEQRPCTLLSEAEMSLIHAICTKWRLESTESIINFAGQQQPCKAAKPGDPIPYEAVLNESVDMLY